MDIKQHSNIVKDDLPNSLFPPPFLLPPSQCPPNPPPAPISLPPLQCPDVSTPPTIKLSPAGLRGLTNKSQVQVTTTSALTESISRLVKFEPDMTGRDWLVYNHHTNPRLQEGPQCGLVVLTTAVNNLLGTDNYSVDHSQSRAVELGFTKQGEMFSADNMAKLGEDLGVKTKVESVSKMLNMTWVVDMLMNGTLMLVPYDCGPSHGPFMAGGRKAHWGLVTGLIVQSGHELDLTEYNKILAGFYHTPSIDSNLVRDIDDMWVIARQSKSLVLGCWKMKELVNSCNNIKILDVKREDKYQIPDGGIEAGLCGKIVLISKK